MKKQPIAIDCSRNFEVSDFDRIMRPPGEPLLVRGAMDQWPALEKWTFDFFKQNYPNDHIDLSPTIRGEQNPINLGITMAEYVDYIQNPETSTIKKIEQAMAMDRPLYAYSYRPFYSHPEMLQDFRLPPFVDDWVDRFSIPYRRSYFPSIQGWVLLGAAGVLSELHQDGFRTIAWLAQLKGRKRCWLFSPEDSPYLYDGQVDPRNPDLTRFPLFEKATLYECVLEPGSMIFLPPSWWHCVEALDPAITLSYNIVNHLNFGEYLKALHGDDLDQFLGRLPGHPEL